MTSDARVRWTLGPGSSAWAAGSRRSVRSRRESSFDLPVFAALRVRGATGTLTSTSMPSGSEANPMKVPCSGCAWSGSRTTATVTRRPCRCCHWWGRNRSSRRPADRPAPRHGCATSRVNGAVAGRFLVVRQRHGEVTRDEACGETERTRRLDHQQGEVAATAVAEAQRLERLLDALGFPPPVAEAVMDALVRRTRSSKCRSSRWRQECGAQRPTSSSGSTGLRLRQWARSGFSSAP